MPFRRTELKSALCSFDRTLADDISIDPIMPYHVHRIGCASTAAAQRALCEIEALEHLVALRCRQFRGLHQALLEHLPLFYRTASELLAHVYLMSNVSSSPTV